MPIIHLQPGCNFLQIPIFLSRGRIAISYRGITKGRFQLGISFDSHSNQINPNHPEYQNTDCVVRLASSKLRSRRVPCGRGGALVVLAVVGGDDGSSISIPPYHYQNTPCGGMAAGKGGREVSNEWLVEVLRRG